jgi:phosphate transport system substrate-binding protein
MLLVLVLGVLLFAAPAGADPPSQINGSGSSWAENAVNQWVSDVNAQGVQVTYNPDGDAQGRQDFANHVSDFAVTSDGYQGYDAATGIDDTSEGRPYAYLPIAAGGTSFPYQIKFDGKQVENLRLSGETLAKIFTNVITNWDDPEITADNNGQALPSLPIVPVVQSEGSGATNQLTSYFASQYPSLWQAFSGQSGPTEYFPRQGDQIAQNGSNGAMNYVSSSEANGAISYVEYSFALSSNYPVVKVLNSAGYYTLPTQYNVAVSLEAAQINMNPNSPDYLLQNLANVYTDPDPRTYPLSSYVYMIEPTGTDAQDTSMTTGKRQALADFGYYAICQGQKEIGPIGYSPLPVNLVEAGFGQLQKLQTADPAVDLASMNILTCNNPTFVLGQPNTNYLATIAPMPPACDKQGAGPCAAGVTPNGIGITVYVSGTYPGSTSSSGAGPGAKSGAATGGAATSAGSTAAGGGAAASASNPDCSTTTTTTATTKPGGAAAGSTAAPPASTDCASATTTTTGPAAATIVNTTLPGADASDLFRAWSPFAVLVLLLAFGIPSFLGVRRIRRRRGEA